MLVKKSRFLPHALLWIALMAALCLSMGISTAQAVGVEADVPEEVIAFYQADSYWNDWTIIGWVNPRQPEDKPRTAERCDTGFALLQWSECYYDIGMFRLTDGQWRFVTNNPDVIPDSHLPVSIVDGTEQLVTLRIVIGDERIPWLEMNFTPDSQGRWYLMNMICSDPDLDMNYEVDTQQAYLWRDDEWADFDQEPWWLDTFVFGEPPWEGEEAGRYAYGPPILMTLGGEEVTFPRGEKYAIYQGPGKEYGRAGNGKACVSTNGPIVCYGAWKDGVLVRYDVNAAKSRYGWVLLSDLPDSVTEQVSTLPFNAHGRNGNQYHYGVIARDTELTDDPSGSRAAVGSLPAGTSVHCLARDEYGWVYVEGYAGESLLMGFVPEDAVDREHGYTKGARREIDEAVTYNEEDIHAAMDAVEEHIADFVGMSLMEIRYEEAANADSTAWWQDNAGPDTQAMILFGDLSDISMTDNEIGAYGMAWNYEWILYRGEGEAWYVGNYGYE